MEPMTIVIAAVAAVGVLLVFVSLAGGSDVNARLERYAAASPAEGAPKKDLGERFATSARLANITRVVERRDWGSNLARELARADVALKPSEFLGIRFGAIVGVPMLMIILSPLISFLGNPIVWIVGVGVGWWLPRFWLNRRKSSPAQGVQLGPGGHDHAACQLAACRFVVSAVRGDGRTRGTAADLDRVLARSP